MYKNDSTGVIDLIGGGGGGTQKPIEITFQPRFVYENRHIHSNESGCIVPERAPLAQLGERTGYLQENTRVVPAWLVHESPGELSLSAKKKAAES